MKKIGLKVNHYKQKTNYRFVIVTENEEIETFPQEVKVSSFWVYDGRTDYLFEVLYEDGKRDSFLEDENSQSVFQLEEMANAEIWKYRHEQIMYKKSDDWYIFCYGSGDKLLGKEIMPDKLYVSECEQNNQKRYQITQLGISGFELICDSYLKAKDEYDNDVFLVHEVGTEPETYAWIDGDKNKNHYDNYEICYVRKETSKERYIWHADTRKLEEFFETADF